MELGAVLLVNLTTDGTTTMQTKVDTATAMRRMWVWECALGAVSAYVYADSSGVWAAVQMYANTATGYYRV